MTKQSSFKRVARERARATGQRYTQARADLELANRQEFIHSRPFEQVALKAHLEEHYRIKISSILPIDDDPATRPNGSWPGHYPSTLVVKHNGGQPWIVRIFSSSADLVSRVQGDAEILRFLATHDFPAERIAHDDPVTVLDGKGMIVTRFIEGGRPSASSPALWFEMAELLARLHTLPAADGAVARDGGAEEHDGGFHVGRPKEDLAASMSFLVSVENKVDDASAEKFEWLRDQVENADDAEGLPEALTHGNYHPWAAVGTPGDIAIVGWAGSGRGPRLPALAWLLRTAAERNGDANVDAVMRGYSRHIRLTDEEFDRLPSILNLRPLWLECLGFRMALNDGRPPQLDEGWMQPASVTFAERLATQAAAAARR
ncbi:phosphotransferase [Microlunatus elymi]|uniref:Phosphotransferase n=1 Tax=Microlunatus elymi TaxID=2596828 RepID=A0A516PYX2_9ACTN|nr:phosphotransferase [Microlunatus elymi]QDP96357.1 phosphotransferase [Microlunatus elymi]